MTFPSTQADRLFAASCAIERLRGMVDVIRQAVEQGGVDIPDTASDSLVLALRGLEDMAEKAKEILDGKADLRLVVDNQPPLAG